MARILYVAKLAVDRDTGLPVSALEGQEVVIVRRGTTTPAAISEDEAGTLLVPGSVRTVSSNLFIPSFWVDPAEGPVSALGGGVEVPLESVEGVAKRLDALEPLLVAAEASAAQSASDARAAVDEASHVVVTTMATYIALARHGEDANFARPSVLGPVFWVGTVIPVNMQSIDFLLEADPSAGGGFEGAFDDFAAPMRAYSLRRILSSYSGPLVQVRRSSDDQVQDIGYTLDGSLDVAALTAFSQGGNVYVTRWYDQTGAGAHLSQSTAAAQPRTMSAGSLDTLNGKPCLVFDGTNDWLTVAATGLYDAGAATMALVFAGSSNANSVVVGESSSAGGGSLYRLIRSSTAAWNVQATNAGGTAMWANSSSGDTTFDGAQHQCFFADSGALINTWRDGGQRHTNLAAARSGTMSLTNLSLGAHLNGGVASNFLTGRVQELVLWGSNQVTDRARISTAQKTFWGTP